MAKQKNWYVGIDVGGTKIQASLCRDCGVVVASARSDTPTREEDAEKTIDCIVNTIQTVLDAKDKTFKDITAIGIAVPGVVDPDGNVVGTPNMNLGGVALEKQLQKRCHVPVAVGNDGNLGTLGESWLGSGHGSQSCIGIFVGTGIGSGIVVNGKLWAGACDAAGEIGHMYMQMDGPLCGCGNHGCFEAVAGRLAIERDICQALADGEKSMIAELMAQKGGRIRSGILNQSLRESDPLVTRVVGQAAKVIGRACLSVRHLLDPETIILGGGLMEACGWYLMPIIQQQMGKDTLLASKRKREVVFSALGDNAVVLGALALARIKVDCSPFKKEFDFLPEYPELLFEEGCVCSHKKKESYPFYIRSDGKIKSCNLAGSEGNTASRSEITEALIGTLTEGGIECLFIGCNQPQSLVENESISGFLRDRNIRCEIDTCEKTVAKYNKSNERRGAIFLD